MIQLAVCDSWRRCGKRSWVGSILIVNLCLPVRTSSKTEFSSFSPSSEKLRIEISFHSGIKVSKLRHQKDHQGKWILTGPCSRDAFHQHWHNVRMVRNTALLAAAGTISGTHIEKDLLELGTKGYTPYLHLVTWDVQVDIGWDQKYIEFLFLWC